MTKSAAIALLFVVLAVGLMFGLARDLLSTEEGNQKGVVTAILSGGWDVKPPSMRPTRVQVKLHDGRIVEAASKHASIEIGREIDVTRLVTPWGQVWYRQRD